MSDQEPGTATAVAGPPDAAEIGRSAGRGLGWALAGNFALKAGSFAVSLVMVRLLAPHDFGLYAVALAANAFVIHVNDMGMIAATVQWRGAVRDMAATATTMAIGFSLGWYALFWVGAPFIADVAGSPEAAPLVRLLTLTIVLDGVTAVSVGVLQRGFRQDVLTKAIAIGFLFSAVISVTLAARGAGAYSFVLGTLAQSVVVGILVLRAARVGVRPGFDRAVARRLLAFGVPLAAGLGVESLLLYSDSVIVGHVLGTVVLGFYLLAFNIASWVPGLIGTAVRYVSIPAFSRLSEDRSEVFVDGVQRTLPIAMAVVAPIATGLVVLSPELIHVLYGAHWVPAAEALRFLAFVMIARMFTALVFDIQTGRGRTRVTLWLNLAWLAALVPALWVGANTGGMRGAAAAHAIVAVVVAIPLAGWMLHRSGVDMRPVLRGVVRPVLAAVVAGLVMLVLSLSLGGPLARLVIGGGLGTAAYLLLALPSRGWVAARAWAASFLPSRRGVSA